MCEKFDTGTSFPQSEAESGHYQLKHSRASFLRWSHGARYEKARSLVLPFAGQRLLDYGCGDGAFMMQVRDLFPDAVGNDSAIDQIADCRSRLACSNRLQFHTCSAMKDESWSQCFDLATCMEVLEHCPEEVVVDVLNDLRRLVKPGGRIVISVPIEIGLALAGKQLLRTVAAWKGIHDYRFAERYSPREFIKMLFASSKTQFDRPIYNADIDDGNLGYHGHKGFNWRRLRTTLADKLTIERIQYSPLNWSRSMLNSQIWFICNNRPR